MMEHRKLNNKVLPVNKSVGVSTYDCIRKFKRVARIRKVGHSGSLDPIARGLILLLTGEATKLSNYLMDLSKRYVADIIMGEATDTQDTSGRVLKTGPWGHISEDQVREVLPRFVGSRMQTPPMFSALKHHGTPLYTLARRGQEIDRRPRKVETYELELVAFDPPVFRISVFCSRGLYVRMLAEEIGEALHVPTHLYGLVRTNIGHFDLETAVSDDEFGSLLAEEEPGYTLSEAVRHLPEVPLSLDQAKRLETGIAPKLTTYSGVSLPPQGSVVRMVDPGGKLGAIGEVGAAGYIKIRRVFRDIGVSGG
ncbi:MAG: tRNA pseudouridine(55) synthase TruB [bacterium]|nr:MAG: tRNA pseudouridine(55) synthase TruB [bacterium]